MNENIDLTKILKDCPEGFELYSSIHGKVKFKNIHENPVYSWISVITEDNEVFTYTSEGKYYPIYNGECVLLPSKEQRDWSKFTAPWYKKEKFDPKTLKPYNKVLVNDYKDYIWKADFYSYKDDAVSAYPYRCVGGLYKFCIPYNEDTKHLVGTTEKAPEYYRYWKD